MPKIKLKTNIIKTIEDAAKSALLEVAEDLKNKSTAQVPVESSALKNDCKITSDGGSPKVRVSYTLPYAVIQHEELGYKHASGKAKFLEDPFNENKESYIKQIAGAVKAALK